MSKNTSAWTFRGAEQPLFIDARWDVALGTVAVDIYMSALPYRVASRTAGLSVERNRDGSIYRVDAGGYSAGRNIKASVETWASEQAADVARTLNALQRGQTVQVVR